MRHLQVLVLLLAMAKEVSSNFTEAQLAQITVGAYYYPWYGKNFHRGKYMRADIGHIPALGEYDDTDPLVIQQHLDYSRQANIGLWVSSWWGKHSREDNTTRKVVFPVLNGTTHKLAVLYETTGRLKHEDGQRQVHRVTEDIEYILDHYVEHPNYYHIRGRPVIFVYLTRVLNDDLAPALLLMRTAAARREINLYIVGDQTFGKPPPEDEEYLPFSYLDAVTNYDVYGTLPKPFATAAGVQQYYHEQAQWRELARKKGCKFIASASPGFNDRGVRPQVDHAPLSRKLNNESNPFGSLFEYALRKAIPQVDRGADRLILINSFNEWHEDTQIEPVNGSLTTEPYNTTVGVEYEGYGTRYLEILNTMTTDGSWIAGEQEEIEWLEQLILQEEGELEEEEEEEEVPIVATRPVPSVVGRPPRPLPKRQPVRGSRSRERPVPKGGRPRRPRPRSDNAFLRPEEQKM